MNLPLGMLDNLPDFLYCKETRDERVEDLRGKERCNEYGCGETEIGFVFVGLS